MLGCKAKYAMITIVQVIVIVMTECNYFYDHGVHSNDL